MPRTCTCCGHTSRAEIDAALVTGTPYRHIAAQFQTSPSALVRHREHVGAMLAKAKEVAEVTLGDDLLAKVRALEGDANRIAKAAEGANDLRTALAGVRELTRIVELLAKLRGELREAATVNITTAVGVQVVAMTLDEQEVRVRNAAAAISRLREKSVLGAGLTTAAPDGNK